MSGDQHTSGKQMNRRRFLNMTGTGLIGASLFSSKAFAGFFAAPAKIGLQLYTVRDQIEKNAADTLHKIAAMGFEGVETAFWPQGISVKDASKLLQDAGLTVCSSHISIPVDDKKEAMLEIAEAYNCKKMIWHGWPEDKRYSSLDGTKELADIYNEANHFAKSNGLQFGLHNHWWEYRNKLEDGRFPYQVLIERVEPDIFFEIDTYWVKVAGHDPAKIVGDFGKRAPLLHIKDGPAKWHPNLAQDNPDPMVAAGKGTQNFPAVVAAANGNTEWMIVEMDKTATDVIAAVQDSYNYLVSNKLATGKI